MKRRFAVLICFAVAIQGALAGTVRWDVFNYGGYAGVVDPSVNALLGASIADSEGYPIAVSVFLTASESISHAFVTLMPSTQEWMPAWGHLWRQFNDGDTVNYSAIFGDHNDYWFHLSDTVYSDRNVTIGQGQSVYLGFGLDGVSMYGWVRLSFDGTSVRVVNSAVDIDGDAIRVGLIPEPAAAALLLAGGIALLVRRKRRARRPQSENERWAVTVSS